MSDVLGDTLRTKLGNEEGAPAIMRARHVCFPRGRSNATVKDRLQLLRPAINTL